MKKWLVIVTLLLLGGVGLYAYKFLNSKIIRETNYPILLFDVLTIEGQKKNYRAILNEAKKITFKEIPEKESLTKTIKVIGKKILSKKLVQINLSDGRNILRIR